MQIFLAILITIAGLGSATAADSIARAGSTKDAPVSLEVGQRDNPFAGLYVGADVGGQFTSIAISGLGYDELFDGLSADGLVYGARAGYNIPFGRLVAGPYVKGGFGDVAVTVADRDLLEMKNYIQTGALLGLQIGDSSLVSVRVGYEWQEWEAGGAFGLPVIDVDAGGWVIGGDIETLIGRGASIGLHVDYVQLSDIEANIPGGDLSRFLKDTEALRVTLGVTWRPSVNLPAIDLF